MNLNHSQKKYLKKSLKQIPLADIAKNLGVSEKELLLYLKSQWSKEKYQKFINQQKREEKPETKILITNLNLKTIFVDNWKVFALLAFLTLAVYFNSLGNDFVSDDFSAIRDNPNLGKIAPLFKPPYFNINFRALINFLTDKIFGLNPMFYRLSNIFFHLGSAWIIYILVGFFFNPLVSFIAASLFAVHPVLIEGVTWISGGPYSNGAFFLLLSFLAYILANKNKSLKIYLSSLFSFYLALLFSEKLIIFPLILLIYEFFIANGSLKNNWKKLTPFFGLSLLWVFYLFYLLPMRSTALETMYYQKPGFYNPLIQIPIAVTSYLELIFWPKNLTLYHSEMSFTQAEYFLRVIIFLLFLGLIIFSFKKDRRIFFWLSFFLISLLPTLNPLGVSWVVAERYVYLGSIGIFAAGAFLIAYLGKKTSQPKLVYVVLTILIFSFGIRTILRNNDWKNQDTLWLATAKTSPSSPQNHNNLGDYYARQGNFEKAVEEFQTAIKLLPNYGDAYHNLGNTYQQMQKDDQAIESYKKALEFNPNLWQSYQNLAAVYFKQGKFNLAKEELEKAIAVNPNNSNLYVNLAIVYLKLNDSINAKKTLNQALLLDPQNPQAKQLLQSF